jgi:hypothetical protein
MKSYFRLAIVTYIFYTTLASVYASSLIVLSGEMNEIQKRTMEKLINKDYPSLKPFVLYDEKNSTCKKHSKALLHLCFLGEKILVVSSQRKKLKKTIKRIMILEDKTEKPVQKEGLQSKI